MCVTKYHWYTPHCRPKPNVVYFYCSLLDSIMYITLNKATFIVIDFLNCSLCICNLFDNVFFFVFLNLYFYFLVPYFLFLISQLHILIHILFVSFPSSPPIFFDGYILSYNRKKSVTSLFHYFTDAVIFCGLFTFIFLFLWISFLTSE